MVILRSCGDRGKVGVDKKISLPKEDQLNQRKSLFCSSDDSELLVWLKRVASDPCNKQVSSSSVRKLRNQILMQRKALSLSSVECPQRKRKFQLFLRTDKFATTLGLVSKRLNNKPVKQLDIDHSYSPNSVDLYSSDSTLMFLKNIRTMNLCSNFSHMYEEKNIYVYNKQISSLVNRKEPINGSFLDSKCLLIEEASSTDSNELILSLNSLSSKEKHQRETTFLKYNYRARPVIPIGSAFQAEIPEWRGPIDGKDLYHNNLKSLKLGSRI